MEDQVRGQGQGVKAKGETVGPVLFKDQIAEILNKCDDARGAVVFCATLSDKKDADGNTILEFHYVRHKYPFEDLPKAVHALRRHVQKDISDFMGMPPSQQ